MYTQPPHNRLSDDEAYYNFVMNQTKDFSGIHTLFMLMWVAKATNRLTPKRKTEPRVDP